MRPTGVELVAACDIDAVRAEAIAEPRGAHAYTRLGGDARARAARRCCGCARRRCITARRWWQRWPAGVNVYLEKPVARTLEDAEAIVAAASAGPGLCTVGYQWHATELLDDVRSALGEMQVGMLLGRNFRPVAGRPWFMDQAPGRRADPGAG